MHRSIQTQVASTIPFDNSSNSFTASEAQSAIEEARNTAIGTPRYTIPLVMNGSLSNGDWVTYSNLTPDSSILIPVNCVLKEITWSNSDTNRSFDMVFYKNGRTTTPYATRQIRNLQYGIITGLSDSFVAGDRLDIKYVDQGLNASDLIVVLFFQVSN